MNSRYERENDLKDLHDPGEQDREISLGTTTILGIFFALALLCAVFFGAGYSLGRHSSQAVATAASAGAETESDSSKPAPGVPSSEGSSSPARSEQAEPDAQGATQEATPAPVRTVIATPAAEGRPGSAAKATAARPVAAAAPAVAGVGSLVVQVAAVSHQEDANILAAALKQRGYNVSVRQGQQDKLLHVQVGPFASKKDADAMRQRLQGDGYNAIVK